MFIAVGALWVYERVSSVPAAFSASGFQFSNEGHISVQANVTNLSSQDEIFQVNANIDGVGIGECSSTISSDGTAPCLMDGYPTIPAATSCAELPSEPDYTLVLVATFAPTIATVTHTYQVTAV